jgi:S-adenosylmethionine:diacylglycerol 3-amino-3-carboxypropyl transferase
MSLHPDILIYLTKFKKIFENSPNKNYFYDENKSDEFYKKVEEIAIDNYEETGKPELTKEQLESIRIYTKNIIESSGKNWVHYSKIGIIYLN